MNKKIKIESSLKMVNVSVHVNLRNVFFCKIIGHLVIPRGGEHEFEVIDYEDMKYLGNEIIGYEEFREFKKDQLKYGFDIQKELEEKELEIFTEDVLKDLVKQIKEGDY
jgi:hypothetical protein